MSKPPQRSVFPPTSGPGSDDGWFEDSGSDSRQEDPPQVKAQGGGTHTPAPSLNPGRIPEPGSQVGPRQQRADVFEQNPLSQVSHQLDSAALALMEDSERVREAVRAVVERGGDLRQAARDWKVAPSSVAEWRERYYELLQQDSIATTGVALFDPDIRRDDMDLVRIPETARVRFLDNWERLVQETVSSPAAFIQSPRQVFLENSWLTCWLYEDRELDKGILAGVISGAVAVVITLSFLVARQASPVVVYTPSPPSAEAEGTGGTPADQAVLAAQAFFQAPNWRERLKLVRHPETVRAGMERYYSTHPDGPIPDAKLVMGLNSKNVTSLNFEIPSQNRSHFLNIAYENGAWQVDWESSSLFQEENLSILRERKSTEPARIAVTVTKNDSYYNYAFSDSSKWTGFELAYPGLPMTLYGYTLRDSQLTIDLEAMLGIIKKQSVILEVRYPENAKSDNQIEILRILGEEWIPGI